MDRLRSEDLKEEKVLTAPAITIAGKQSGWACKTAAIPLSSKEIDDLRTCCPYRESEPVC